MLSALVIIIPLAITSFTSLIMGLGKLKKYIRFCKEHKLINHELDKLDFDDYKNIHKLKKLYTKISYLSIKHNYKRCESLKVKIKNLIENLEDISGSCSSSGSSEGSITLINS